MSENIRPQHLGRKAILYVRQSSPYQVTHNLESQKLQYAMMAAQCGDPLSGPTISASGKMAIAI